MTDYTKNASFTAKTGTTIEGADFDAEFDEIATAIASKEDEANKGAADGYCGLDSSGLVAAADLPAATTSAQGAVELATTAEIQAGTDATRAVTPAGLAAAGVSSLTAVKSSDTSRSSTTTKTADPHLSVAVEASSAYRIEAFIRAFSTSATPDIRTIFTGPAGSTYQVIYHGGNSGFRIEGNVSEASEISSSLGASVEQDIYYEGILDTAGTAGNFTFDWAQLTSDATATSVLTYSYLKLTKLA